MLWRMRIKRLKTEIAVLQERELFKQEFIHLYQAQNKYLQHEILSYRTDDSSRISRVENAVLREREINLKAEIDRLKDNLRLERKRREERK